MLDIREGDDVVRHWIVEDSSKVYLLALNMSMKYFLGVWTFACE